MTPELAPVTHDERSHRFEITADGLTAVADYDPIDAAWVFGHTESPPEWRGRGVAARLVEAGLSAARKAGVKVVPTCSYVAAYMKRHPETHDLLHDGWRTQLGL